jgi:hypothetical protein
MGVRLVEGATMPGLPDSASDSTISLCFNMFHIMLDVWHLNGFLTVAKHIQDP